MSHRWLASLFKYNFKLNYKAGKSNRDADGLPRRPAEIFPNVIKALKSAVLVEKKNFLWLKVLFYQKMLHLKKQVRIKKCKHLVVLIGLLNNEKMQLSKELLKF